MSLIKSRFLVTGLAVVGVASAVALGFAAPHIGGLLSAEKRSGRAVSEAAASGPLVMAEKNDAAAQPKVPAAPGDSRREVKVEAPSTTVNVDRDRGKVRVTAPHTDVRVDPNKSRVQVRAPYVNLDIRW